MVYIRQYCESIESNFNISAYNIRIKKRISINYLSYKSTYLVYLKQTQNERKSLKKTTIKSNSRSNIRPQEQK